MAKKEKLEPHLLTIVKEMDREDGDGRDKDQGAVERFLQNSGKKAVPEYMGRPKNVDRR